MGADLQVLQADGSRLTFHCDPTPRCVGRSTEEGVITRVAQGWLWRWPFGKCLRFDEPGRLIGWSLVPANKRGRLQGNCREALDVHIVRHQVPSRWHGELDRVIDTRTNQSLQFIYASTRVQQTLALTTPTTITSTPSKPSTLTITTTSSRSTGTTQKASTATVTTQTTVAHKIVTPTAERSEELGGLVAVESPLGMFRYVYETDTLVEVIRPDGMRRRYHHEEFLQAGHTHVVTGISLVNQSATQVLRTHTWQYDRAGRVQTFTPGAPTSLGSGLPTGLPDAALGLTIRQDVKRVIRQVSFHGKGWPGLRLWFDGTGHLTQWHSRGVALERFEYQTRNGLHRPLDQTDVASQIEQPQSHSRLVARQFGEQGHWRWDFDSFGRARRLQARSSFAEPIETRVAWRGLHPAVIAHPEETQQRRFNASGGLRERVVFRRTTGTGLSKVFRPEWSYREAFTYDARGRRLTHVLPEGGVLHYLWSHTTLRAMEWEKASGERQKILEVGPLGLLHGNGLLTVRQMARSQAIGKQATHLEQLMVYQPATHLPLYRHQIAVDPHARLSHESMTLAGQTRHTSYDYDVAQRLRRHRTWSRPSNQTSTREYAWRTSGAARQAITRDATGLPTRADRFVLRYNAQRRLTGVVEQRDAAQTVTYGHNAFGEQIWREDQEGRTQYLFDEQKMVAQGYVDKSGLRIKRRFIYLHQVPIGAIEYGNDATQSQLYYFHTDAVGLPQFLTDARQAIRWRAIYSPLGELLEQHHDLGKDFVQPLRLPGQVADPLTGWHDNYQRTYDPRWGHYLEPDPLGPIPGNSQYGYADQQPRRYVDPLGLLLFAFDGTGNSPTSQTNVWLFAGQYQGGAVKYIEGPAGDLETGSAKHAMDAAVAWSGGSRVDQQWERWLNAIALQREGVPALALDVVGFSRGAALARHFGNRVAQHTRDGRFWLQHPQRGVLSSCVDLRFMGLFDTVAQFNVLGAGNAAFDLTIAPAWKWVAHAVALHEHRWLFPLTSARGTQVGGNVVERAFVGAHADIGGGYLTRQTSPGSTPGDLSQVALAWMHWQAKAAGVPLGAGPTATSVTRPIVHDERAVFARTMQRGDRRVNQPDGRLWVNYQEHAPTMGAEVRRQVESLLARTPPLLPQAPDAVGWVDMPRYTKWLRDEVGWHWD
jgi:RHS repeat-associated protein